MRLTTPGFFYSQWVVSGVHDEIDLDHGSRSTSSADGILNAA